MLSDLDRKKIYYNGIENLVFMKENLHVHLAKPEVNVKVLFALTLIVPVAFVVLHGPPVERIL
jgi:hypothetical protein